MSASEGVLADVIELIYESKVPPCLNKVGHPKAELGTATKWDRYGAVVRVCRPGMQALETEMNCKHIPTRESWVQGFAGLGREGRGWNSK